MSVALQRAYLRGYIDGLWAFSWMKDGVTYVGTCGTTLKEAVAAAERDYAVVEDVPEPDGPAGGDDAGRGET